MEPPIDVENPEITVLVLRHAFEKYMKNNPRLESVVLGVSGGIDSALVAALVAPVCKKLGKAFITVSLPSATNKNDEVTRANHTMDFGSMQVVNTIEHLVDPLVKQLDADNEDPHSRKIRIGNVKARVRMILLYGIAGQFKGMVLGTDNWTEQQLGFWTLHGDVGDFSLIQYIKKTDVYRLAQWIADNELEGSLKAVMLETIKAVPTDGLGITNSDLDQIGAKSYEEVDKILEGYLEGERTRVDNIEHPVIVRHLNSEFKRNNPYVVKY
jgi:NAD+ synthetase